MVGAAAEQQGLEGGGRASGEPPRGSRIWESGSKEGGMAGLGKHREEHLQKVPL